jgi:SAM-dependent methyltransferase
MELEVQEKSFFTHLKNKSEILSGNERDFFIRVWRTDPEIYKSRLKAIGFSNLDKVLDAGCGYGQWSASLAELNTSVYSVDNSEVRIKLLEDIAETLELNNLNTQVGSIENIEVPDSEFDAIFCYSVIFFTDYKKAIKEFYRVLKPGGKLYICSNGLGWYLYNILSGYNSSTDFDSRRMGIKALENTLSYLSSGTRTSGEQLVIPGKVMVTELNANNFSVKGMNGEGLYNENETINISSFFKEEYLGAEGVYEVIAIKNS